MKTQPIVPAQIEWRDGGVPFAPVFADVYHAQVGAAEQARAVFLAGNGLPGRWAGRADFVVCETGFGLGNNFLATWNALRSDPRRCMRLHYVAIEAHPPRGEDLRRAPRDPGFDDLAAELARAWPPLTPNLHALDLADGRVRLLLAFGDIARVLPELVFRADAFYLDGFAPSRNPAMWQTRVLQALGRRAAPGATVATWSAARLVRDGLAAAGFTVERHPGIGGKRDVTIARHAPRPAQAAPALVAPALSQRVLVIGAGLAGASTANALAQLGWQVVVFEQGVCAANAASGNPAGLFHGTVHADDSPHARLFRAAALQARRSIEDLPALPPHGGTGLLRLETVLDVGAMATMLERQGLPPAYVQALSPDAAAALAGVPIAHPAWFYPGGGWVSPTQWVQHLLTHPAIRLQLRAKVDRIECRDDMWHLLAPDGSVLDHAPTLVLANAEGATPLLHAADFDLPALQRTRGQVSWWQDASASVLAAPVAGAGYASPLPAGGVLCGATTSDGSDLQPSLDDHRRNFERLQRLTGLCPPADPQLWHGRVGWRLQADDRLPLAGPLPARVMPPGQRLDQPRLLPRTPGLYIATAFGGRGLTLAPLLGRLVAAQIAGTPWPLEQSLVDAVDPARALVRAARKSGQKLSVRTPVGVPSRHS